MAGSIQLQLHRVEVCTVGAGAALRELRSRPICPEVLSSRLDLPHLCVKNSSNARSDRLTASTESNTSCTRCVMEICARGQLFRTGREALVSVSNTQHLLVLGSGLFSKDVGPDLLS